MPYWHIRRYVYNEVLKDGSLSLKLTSQHGSLETSDQHIPIPETAKTN